MKKLILIGAGGHSGEMLWLINEINNVAPSWEIIGYVDDNISVGKKVKEITILGDTNWLLEYQEPINVMISIGDPSARKNIYEKLKVNPLIHFPTFVSPTAIIGLNISIGEGSIICDNNLALYNVNIGKCCLINFFNTIGHDAIIDDFTTVFGSSSISGGVQIGKCSTIGSGARIIQYLTIGENTVVGAGAVINKSFPEGNCTLVGVPARKIK